MIADDVLHACFPDSAWNKTQPKPIFSEPLPDQKDKKDEKK